MIPSPSGSAVESLLKSASVSLSLSGLKLTIITSVDEPLRAPLDRTITSPPSYLHSQPSFIPSPSLSGCNGFSPCKNSLPSSSPSRSVSTNSRSVPNRASVSSGRESASVSASYEFGSVRYLTASSQSENPSPSLSDEVGLLPRPIVNFTLRIAEKDSAVGFQTRL